MAKVYLQTNVIVADVRYLYEIYPASLSFHRKHQIVLIRTGIGRTNFTNACLSKKQDNVWHFQQVYRTVRKVSRKRSLTEGDDGALFLPAPVHISAGGRLPRMHPRFACYYAQLFEF